MSEKFRLYGKIGFRNTFYTKCINGIIDSIGPSIILRSIYPIYILYIYYIQARVFKISQNDKLLSENHETTEK